MTFWTDHLKRMADLYAHLCRIDVVKDRYVAEVKRLAEQDPDVYADLPRLVGERMREIKHAGNRN